MQLPIQIIVAIIVGGLSGSLINLVATRLPADLALAGLPLRPWDETPSASALIPYAGARDSVARRFDWPKLGTECAAVAIVWIALAARDASFEAARAIVFSLLLLLILRVDWQNHLIFMITIVPGLAVALGFNALDSSSQLLSSAAAGIGAAFIFLLLFMLAFAIYHKRALGMGDIFLAGLIGTMTGLQGVGGALLLGIFLAAVGGLALVAVRVRSRNDYIPYGAYLSLGAIIVLLIGHY